MYKCKDTKEEVKTYEEYLKTKHWTNIKKLMYKTFYYQCSACKKKKDLAVHHLTYERVGEEKLSDLIYLCRDCHKSIHEGALENPFKYVRVKKEKKKVKQYKKKKSTNKPSQKGVRTYKLNKEQLEEYKATGALPNK